MTQTYWYALETGHNRSEAERRAYEEYQATHAVCVHRVGEESR